MMEMSEYVHEFILESWKLSSRKLLMTQVVSVLVRILSSQLHMPRVSRIQTIRIRKNMMYNLKFQTLINF